MAFTEDQISALKAKLDGDAVKTRKQAGRDLSYIEGWRCIAEANRIFGFDAWDRETVETRMVTEVACRIGKPPYEKDGWRVGYICKVRIIVSAGEGRAVLRDGTGYGSGIDADLGSAHESAIKESETDAMKRALMTFGNPFGLALYDKDQSEVDRSPANPPANSPKAPPPPQTGAQIEPWRVSANTIKAAIDASPHLTGLNALMDQKGHFAASKDPRVGSDLEIIKMASEEAYAFLIDRANKRRSFFMQAPADQRKAS